MLAYIHYPEWLSPRIISAIPIYWYSLSYLVGFAVTYVLFQYQIKDEKIKTDDDTVINFFFWTILGLLIGARVFSALVYDPTGLYRRQPWLVFWPFQNGQFTGLAGMSYHGGVLGACIAAVMYLKIKKLDILHWGDMLVAAIPLGYTLGRLGNFANQELYGRITSSPLGMLFPNAAPVPINHPGVQQIAKDIGWDLSGLTVINLPRHPSQLYEAFFEGIVLWIILWFIFRKQKAFKGLLIGLYMIGYGFFRFVIEYFRQPDDGLDFPLQLGTSSANYELTSLLNFSTGQILNMLMISGGILFLVIAAKKQKTIQEKTPPSRKKRRKRRK